MLLQEALQQGERVLEAAGVQSARLDSLLLLEAAVGSGREKLLANPSQKLSLGQNRRFRALLKKRSAHVPLAYLTGFKEFYGLQLAVSPAVLIPRPETESLVEYCLARAPANGKLLDVGTGCGAIAIALKHERSDLSVTASDNSQAALNLAHQNTQNVGVELELIQSDLFEKIKGRFDVIAANLPYLEPRPRQISLATKYEPRQALFGGGPDGLDTYRRFLAQAGAFLTPNGQVVLEANPWQHQVLADFAAQAGLKLHQRQGLRLVLARLPK